MLACRSSVTTIAERADVKVTTLGHLAACVIKVVANGAYALVQDGASSFVHSTGVEGKIGAKRSWHGNQ